MRPFEMLSSLRAGCLRRISKGVAPGWRPHSDAEGQRQGAGPGSAGAEAARRIRGWPSPAGRARRSFNTITVNVCFLSIMTMHYPKLDDVVLHDPRYPYEA